MAVTFNPPPTWPAPPKGWVPGDDWRPDPTWVTPEGWRIFEPLPWWNKVTRKGVAWILFGLAWAVASFLMKLSQGAQAVGGVIVWLGVVVVLIGFVAHVKSAREAAQRERRLRK